MGNPTVNLFVLDIEGYELAILRYVSVGGGGGGPYIITAPFRGRKFFACPLLNNEFLTIRDF